MRKKRGKSAVRRAFVACVILVVVVFAPVAIDRVLGFLEEQRMVAQALEKVSALTATYVDDASSAEEAEAAVTLSEIGTMLPEAGTTLPDDFEEVGLSFASDISLVSDGEHLIGAVISDDSESVFDELSADLIEAGWIAVESGVDGVGSFVREEGSYTWLALACYGVGEMTGVVISIW